MSQPNEIWLTPYPLRTGAFQSVLWVIYLNSFLLMAYKYCGWISTHCPVVILHIFWTEISVYSFWLMNRRLSSPLYIIWYTMQTSIFSWAPMSSQFGSSHHLLRYTRLWDQVWTYIRVYHTLTGFCIITCRFAFPKNCMLVFTCGWMWLSCNWHLELQMASRASLRSFRCCNTNCYATIKTFPPSGIKLAPSVFVNWPWNSQHLMYTLLSRDDFKCVENLESWKITCTCKAIASILQLFACLASIWPSADPNG